MPSQAFAMFTHPATSLFFWGGGGGWIIPGAPYCAKNFFKMSYRFYNHVSTVLKCSYSTTIYFSFTNIFSIPSVCFECLRFRLRLSLSGNSRMTCVRPNCHLAVQKFSHLFLLKTAKWQFGQTFQNKKYLYF